MTALKDVLYVEDDPDIQEIVKLTLEHLGGMTVHLCDSYKMARAKLEHYTPQLILLDIMMPEFDGLKTLEALRQLPAIQNVPVIFITAKVQKQEIDHYLAQGAIGVIKKPFDPTTLVGSINALWTEYNQK